MGNGLDGQEFKGKFWWHGRDYRAYRWAYEHFIGPIPDGFTIDHLCRVTRCVRPDHLEAVSLKVNIMRGNGVGVRAAQQTHCVNGHPFSEKNTGFNVRNGSKRRRCHQCDYLSTVRQRAKRKNLGRTT